MNSFSNFGSMLARGSQNVNSINYINRYAKAITTDFSGLSSQITDLSNTSLYQRHFLWD